MMREILIVGGGASGLLVATHLAGKVSIPTSITIAEPRATLGSGIAYGTFDDAHLLNVPAGRMSVFPSQPNHFQSWANSDAGDFISRRRYGQYLLETFLSEQIKNSAISFRHDRSVVQSIEKVGDEFHVIGDGGPLGIFDSVVLALGQGLSYPLNVPMEVAQSPKFVGDPWRDTVPSFDGVMVSVGTGLTFVDLALSHLRRNSDNTVIGLSRTGALPEKHLPVRAAPLPVPEWARKSPEDLRKHIEASDDWRAAQDGVRHELPEIWFKWSEEAKRSFWSQHLRWWNVHRHRMSPEIADEISKFSDEGRFRILKMQSSQFSIDDGGIKVSINGEEEMVADLVVNTTGYRSAESLPLISKMKDAGLISIGPLGMGISTNFPSFEILDSSGNIVPRLFGIGPILLGERFETTAIPEVRDQAEQIALSLSAL